MSDHDFTSIRLPVLAQQFEGEQRDFMIDLLSAMTENFKRGLGMNTDFYLEVAKGNVPGHSAVNKFGHNPAVDTSGEDLWAGGGTYGFWPTSGVSIDIKSSAAADGVAGTGALTCVVYGLDGDWKEQTSEVITLNGLTEVAIAGTWMRIFRLVVLTAGTYGTNVGNLTVQCVGAGGGLLDNTIGIYVAADDGQTQQAIYTIPAGKTGFFIKGYVGLADDDKNGETAGFKWKARPNNGTSGAWAVKGQISLVSIGSGHWQYAYGIPAGPLPEKTDIKLEVYETTAILGVVGGFDILLVDHGF